MIYWDNEVTFSFKEGLSLIGGSFEINDFCITSGQDPDKNIKKGAKSPVVNNSLHFRIGHKGTTQTADWFNQNVSASQTTFNHSADKLNFALLGTLNLTIAGSLLAGTRDTYTFSNVMLAQGHSVGNNWWFGGKQCTYIGANKVRCIGKNSKGQEVTAVFLRGDNDIKTIVLESISVVDLANWMKNIDGNKQLRDLMMPGSHDAGMSTLHHCSDGTGIIIGPFTQTQSKTVGGQLACGSRYFDIRVDYDHSALVTYHRSDANGCNGQDLKEVLDETVSFLNAHPGEIAILKISHIRNYKDHKKQETGDKICTMLDNYQAHMYKVAPADAKKPINLAELPLKDLRGKMVVVFSDEEFCDLSKGRFRYNDGTTIYDNVNLTVYDEYSDEQNYDKMKKDQLDKWNINAVPGRKYFFLLSWTLTPKGPFSVESLANEANKKLPAVLLDGIITKGYSKPNVVYIDYVSEQTSQSIVLYNYIDAPRISIPKAAGIENSVEGA